MAKTQRWYSLVTYTISNCPVDIDFDADFQQQIDWERPSLRQVAIAVLLEQKSMPNYIVIELSSNREHTHIHGTHMAHTHAHKHSYAHTISVFLGFT